MGPSVLCSGSSAVVGVGLTEAADMVSKPVRAFLWGQQAWHNEKAVRAGLMVMLVQVEAKTLGIYCVTMAFQSREGKME